MELQLTEADRDQARERASHDMQVGVLVTRGASSTGSAPNAACRRNFSDQLTGRDDRGKIAALLSGLGS